MLRNGETARTGGAPRSPTLSPFVPHGAREPDALLDAAISARSFATIESAGFPTCCIADFQIGRGRIVSGACGKARRGGWPDGLRVWKPALRGGRARMRPTPARTFRGCWKNQLRFLRGMSRTGNLHRSAPVLGRRKLERDETQTNPKPQCVRTSLRPRTAALRGSRSRAPTGSDRSRALVPRSFAAV